MAPERKEAVKTMLCVIIAYVFLWVMIYAVMYYGASGNSEIVTAYLQSPIATPIATVIHVFFFIIAGLCYMLKKAIQTSKENDSRQFGFLEIATNTEKEKLLKTYIPEEERQDVIFWNKGGIVCFPKGKIKDRYRYREDWFNAFLTFCHYYFRHAGYRLPGMITIRTKFYKNDQKNKVTVGGYAEANTNEIVLNDDLFTHDVVKICATIMHELCHISLYQSDINHTHKRAFIAMAQSIGLIITNKEELKTNPEKCSTQASPKLHKFLSEFIPAFLGTFPHE